MTDIPYQIAPIVRAEGRVVSLGGAAFAEGKPFDNSGRLCGSATTTCPVFGDG